MIPEEHALRQLFHRTVSGATPNTLVFTIGKSLRTLPICLRNSV